jgi:hypothetical protein
LGFGFWVLGFGFWVLGFGIWVAFDHKPRVEVTHGGRYELMFCSADSEELVALVSQAGGVGCMLQDIVHLTTTIALPLVQKQMQVTPQNRPPALTTLCHSASSS